MNIFEKQNFDEHLLWHEKYDKIDAEDRKMYHEHLTLYNDRLKMELDQLPVISAGIKEIKDLFAKLSITIYGNGNPENGLCFRTSFVEKEMKALNAKINALFKTDDWRKDFLAGAIRAVLTAVIAAVLLKYLIK